MVHHRCFIDGVDGGLFNLHNLPYGIFSTPKNQTPRVGTRVGDFVLDLACLETKGILKTGLDKSVFSQKSLNLFAEQGQKLQSSIRSQLQKLLSAESSAFTDDLLDECLNPISHCTMHLPFDIGGFTDFYAGIHHAKNVGKLFRGSDTLMPNWKHLPVAYNGRASTVFVSDHPIPRPHGLIKTPADDNPVFCASQKLDYELELGVFIGVGNPDATPISVNDASKHMFGCVLLNDWSARDIQAYEYQPLGPFLGKSFGTSVSPWVVTMEALEPFLVPLATQNPKPCSYLYEHPPMMPEIHLEIDIIPKGSDMATRLCETKSTELYWSLSQMLSHHTVNHCIMKTGDLIGTGTISGQEPKEVGSLLERTLNGQEPITLSNGETRRFLENGDTIIMRGYCKANEISIGLGEVKGIINMS